MSIYIQNYTLIGTVLYLYITFGFGYILNCLVEMLSRLLRYSFKTGVKNCISKRFLLSHPTAYIICYAFVIVGFA